MGVLPDGTKDFGYLDKEVQRQDFDPQRYVYGLGPGSWFADPWLLLRV